MLFAMSLEQLLTLAEKDKVAAVKAAEIIIVPWSRALWHNFRTFFSNGVNGPYYGSTGSEPSESLSYILSNADQMPRERRFVFDRNGAFYMQNIQPCLEQGLLLDGESNRVRLIRTEMDGNITKVVIGLVPPEATEHSYATDTHISDRDGSITKVQRQRPKHTAYVYVECGDDKMPCLADDIDRGLPFSALKPIIYFAAPLPDSFRSVVNYNRMILIALDQSTNKHPS
ncbi:hypothetical protein HYU16_04410 [Candidatus Woesearchaeota archaeon]|nr:hypothetical protein [Candidatus Woesearchaeota archaeon]